MLFEKSNAINFGNEKCHLRNQTRQILEIKSVIGEIKRDKFWKSKVLLEKSNAINFGNQNDTIKPRRILLLIIDKISKS